MVHCARVSLFSFVALLCMTITLRAQVPLMQWYTVDDGLPSSQVYQVLQDRNGFIWCCTGNGIARFDGTSFVSFSIADGFPDRGAYHMIEDSKGRIWFLTFSGKTCYYDKGLFHLPEIPLVKNNFVRWIEEMPGGRLLFLTNNGSVIMQWPDGRFRNYPVSRQPLFHSHQLGADTLIIASDSYFCLQLSTGKVTKLDIPTQVSRRFIRVFPVDSQKLLLTADHGFYQYDHGQLSFLDFGKEIMPAQVCTMQEKNGDLWIGTYGGAIRFAGGHIDTAHMEWKLKDHGITSIIKDHEGNLWFSIFNEGVCMLPQQFMSVYNHENGLIPDRNLLRIVTGNDKQVYAFSSTGDIFRIDSAKAVRTGRLPLGVPAVEVISAYQADPEVMFVGANSFFRFKDGVITRDTAMSNFFLSKLFAFSRPGYWIFPGQQENMLEINEYNEKTKKYSTRWRSENVRHGTLSPLVLVEGNQEGSYWIGTRQGPVYLGADKSTWFVADEIPELHTMITTIVRDVLGNIWIGTATAGIFCFDGKKMIGQYNTTNGLPGNSSNSLYADDAHGVWVCSNDGLAWIRPGNIKPVTVFRSPEVLPGQEAISMCKLGHRVFVATTKGIGSFMDNAARVPAVFPPVYISNVKVNGQDKNIFTSFELEPGQNNIELNFDAIAFRKSGKMNYRYQLEGADTEWNYTTTSHIQYRSLQPGHYTFRVFALNAAGLSSKIPAVLSFTIHPAWWQTWWFRVLAIIFLSGMLFLMVFLRVRAVRKAARIRQQWLETRLHALRAQINPHFVFNALNSVQSFIFSRQPEEANEYLVNFARMMRMISEGAEKETILVHEEIAFLEYYICMEKLRFENDFQYSIEIDPQVDVNSFRIPPMILQPVIENAFKHGLAEKEGEKKLLICFSGEAHRLHVRIEDNGTGRKSRRIEKELAQNKLGIVNVIQRLLLLRGRPGKNNPVTITDLYDANGNPAGVRVDLLIALPVKKSNRIKIKRGQ